MDYWSIWRERTEFLELLPWPKEKKDLLILLLPSPLLELLTWWTFGFCCKISWTDKHSCLSAEESMEKDLLMGCIEKDWSFPLTSIHSSPILQTWWNFLPSFIFGSGFSIEFWIFWLLEAWPVALSTPNSMTTSPGPIRSFPCWRGLFWCGSWPIIWSLENGLMFEMFDLQRGQFALLWSQVSMQSMWNAWSQFGRSLSFSSSWNSFKQTAHSLRFFKFFSFSNRKIGIERMTDSSSPLFSIAVE